MSQHRGARPVVPSSPRSVFTRKRRNRRGYFEALEPRQVLAAPTLAVIADLTVANSNPLYGGAPMNIALNGGDADGDPLTYTVSVTNSNVALTTTVPQGNPSLKMTVDDAADSIHGDMIFQLFPDLVPDVANRIQQLAGQGFYNGLTFHRVIKDFMIQGGDPKGDGTGGSGTQFDDEFNPALQFTSSGILAMAKTADDTNDSQFFITSGPTRWLDFQHSIFGFLTDGDSVRQQIENVQTNSSTNKPLHTVTISSVSVVYDAQRGVLRLSAPNGATGEADVTVTAHDSHGETASRTFHVSVRPDTNNDPPFLGTIAPVKTTANTLVTLQIPATDVEGDPIYYTGAVSPANANIAINVNSSTGQATVTPSGGVVGVYSLHITAQPSATSDSSLIDSQYVPLYINPAAPTVQLQPISDTGSSSSDRVTNLNNTPGKTLFFRVDNVLAGTTVELLSDGAVIGTATPTSSGSVVIETNGTVTLTDGTHNITARQTLKNQAVHVGDFNTTVDLTSPDSPALQVTVDTAAPQFTSTAPTTATEEQPYAYAVQSNEEGNPGMAYQLTASPSGMVIEAATGQITWTPADGQAGTQSVTVQATDLAGNAAQQSFSIDVALAAPTADPQTISTLANTELRIQLTGSKGSTPGSTFQFAIASGPADGTIKSDFDPATGVLTYVPSAGFVGSDEFTFTVSVSDAATGKTETSAPAKVTISVKRVNHAPVANPQSVTGNEDSPFAIRLTGDDGETSVQQSLIYTITRQPAHGALSGFDAATGTVLYTPNADFYGQDSFDFTVTDHDVNAEPASLSSQPARVAITVNNVPDPPRWTVVQNPATAAVGNTWQGRDQALDPDHVSQIVYDLGPGAPQGMSIDPATGEITWLVPESTPPGEVSFVVRATDVSPTGQTGLQSSRVVQITVTDLRPALFAAAANAAQQQEQTATQSRARDEASVPEASKEVQVQVLAAPAAVPVAAFAPAARQSATATRKPVSGLLLTPGGIDGLLSSDFGLFVSGGSSGGGGSQSETSREGQDRQPRPQPKQEATPPAASSSKSSQDPTQDQAADSRSADRRTPPPNQRAEAEPLQANDAALESWIETGEVAGVEATAEAALVQAADSVRSEATAGEATSADAASSEAGSAEG